MRDIDIGCIKKAQKGDKLSFDRIITIYRETVVSICYKYMRNSEEANDMAQEVFCAAYGALPKFEYKSKFSTWIYRIAVNLCINRLDSLKRRKYFETESIHEDKGSEKSEIPVADTSVSADRQLEAKETREIILDALSSFPEQEKNIVILRDMQGFEYGEISEVLKIPLGSVKSKLSRAREKLKEKIIRKMGV